MDAVIREATQEDYEGLCQVIAELDALHREALPHVFREAAGPVRSKGYIAGIIADENAALFVAERDHCIIGFVHSDIREAPDIPIMLPRQYAVLHDIAVSRDCQGFGVGQALLEKAQQWALDKGVGQIELNVWEFNREAITFYEKHGYATTSRKMWRALG